MPPPLSWLYSSDQYFLHLLRISCSSVRHFPDLSWIVEDLPCYSEVRYFTADMLSCCCFCSSKFQSHRTEHLSSPSFLSSLPSESSCLLSCIFCSFCFIPLLLQISPLITEVKTYLVTHGFFLRRFFQSISLAASVTAVL